MARLLKGPIQWVLVAFLVSVLSHHVSAQNGCVTCHDYSTFNDYPTSPSPDECGSDTCESGAPLGSIATAGLFTSERDGRLFVSGVVPRGPAAKSGIHEGEEIVAVNGKSPKQGVGASMLERPNSASVMRLVLRNPEGVRTVVVHPTQLVELLDKFWVPASAGNASLTPVSLLLPESADCTAFGLYMFGLSLKDAGDKLVITRILLGSPSNLAGLIPNDNIIAIDGLPVKQLGRAAVAKLSATDHRVRLSLTVTRDGASRTIEISSEGVTQILRERALAEKHTGDTMRIATR